MDDCENFNTFIIRDICAIIDEKNKMWTDVVEHTEPRPKCPFDKKSLKMTNATWDMSYVDHLPLDGHIWIFFMKLFKSIPNVRHKKESIFCMMFESKITKSHLG